MHSSRVGSTRAWFWRPSYARRARAVHEIPFDPALQPGGRILLRKLSSAARQAYLEVTADIMAGVASR